MCPRLIATVTRHAHFGNIIAPHNIQLLFSFFTQSQFYHGGIKSQESSLNFINGALKH